MIKTAFTCNSLRTKHFIHFMRVWVSSCRKAGKFIQLCCRETANFFNVETESVFLFGSARMGLYSLLMSVEEQGKDEVIVAGYTCVVVTNAIKYAGLQAVYIDVEEDSLNIDPSLLRMAINQRTKAIIITHNYGITCEYVENIRREHPDIMIIEDAAHTFGSVTQEGKKAGTLGDASFFSLEYSKPISSGMGGIILLNDQQLRDRFEKYYSRLGHFPGFTNFKIFSSLVMHLFTSSRYTVFMKKWMSGALYLTGLLYKSPPGELQGDMPVHYPVKLSPYLAYFAYMQIVDINSINKKKDMLCKAYHETLKGIPGIRQYYSTNYNYVRYPVLFEAFVEEEKIMKIKTGLKQMGIQAGEWFNDVVHPKGSLRYCYIDGSCPIGESLSRRMINFPVTVHRQLTNGDLEKVRNIFLKHLQVS